MDTRRLSVLCLVIMIGLAGCSGLSPFGESTNTADGEPHDISHPAGYNESGITNPEKAADQHESALDEYDNSTLKLNVSGVISPFDVDMNISVTADTADQIALFSMSGVMEGEQFMEESMYHSDGMTYEMNKTMEEQTQYDGYRDSFGGSSLGGFITSFEWLTNAHFGNSTRVTHDGEPMFRYNATGADSAEPFITGLDDNPTLNEFNGTLFVDEDGVIRSFSYTMNYTTTDGKQKTMTADYQTTGLNTTTVEEPDWVETAKERAA